MGDGESNWLEGLVLMGLYAIIALFFWYYPGTRRLTFVIRFLLRHDDLPCPT